MSPSTILERAGFPADAGRPLLFGMVHLGPLPGSPRDPEDFEATLRAASADLDALVGGGADGAIVENFGDAPFLPDAVPPVTVAAMTVAAARLRAQAPGAFLLGVNVLRNDAAAALSIAAVTGASCIRVNVHLGAAVTDQGILRGRADETLRLRRALGRPVAIFADVDVKHAAPVAARPVEEEALDLVERGLADVLLVTGPRTGAPVDLERLRAVRTAVPAAPIYAASGVTADSVRDLAPYCDGFIAGTWLKRDGRVGAPVDPERVRKLAAAVRAIVLPSSRRPAAS